MGLAVAAVGALSDGPRTDDAGEAEASPIAGQTRRMLDQGSGEIVEVDVSALDEAQDAYVDQDGNPTHLIVLRHGRLVRGPALACSPNEVEGEPDVCTLAE